MIDVVAIGELLIDFTHQGVNEAGYPILSANPGGAPANFLATLAKLGAKTAMLGKVGNDAFGRQLLCTLTQAGIATRGMVSSADVFTTLAFVTLDERGEREFSFARKPGADTMLRADELELSLIEEAKVLHFGTLSLSDEPARTATHAALEHAERLGKLITFDPNLRLPLWKSPDEAGAQMLWGLQRADVVKISDEELQFLFGLPPREGAEKILRDFPAQLVFVTCGADGCHARSRQTACDAACPSGLDVVDTTGAGDIFGGAAVYQLLQTGKRPEALSAAELEEITAFACTAASLSTTRQGGIPSIPTMEEILHVRREMQ